MPKGRIRVSLGLVGAIETYRFSGSETGLGAKRTFPQFDGWLATPHDYEPGPKTCRHVAMSFRTDTRARTGWRGGMVYPCVRQRADRSRNPPIINRDKIQFR